MNQQTSPARRHRYDIARVIRVWQLSRTTFYVRRTRRDHPAATALPGSPAGRSTMPSSSRTSGQSLPRVRARGGP